MPRKNTPVRKAQSEFSIIFGLGAVVLFFVVSSVVSYQNTSVLNNDAALVTHTHEVITSLDEIISLMKDAETGQRGYVLTGDTKYLEPYSQAIVQLEQRITNLQQATRDNPDQQSHIPVIREHVARKLAELAETINLRREKGFDVARAVIATDRGKNDMDIVRAQVQQMLDNENELRRGRFTEMTTAYETAISSGFISGALGVVLSLFVAYLLQRAAAVRKRQDWLQAGQVGLADAMFGDQDVARLGENILKFLSEYFDAHAAAFFAREGNHYRRIATYGVPADTSVPTVFMEGEGLLGQAVRDGRTFIVDDVPDGYLKIGSGLGQGNPRNLMISPTMSDDGINAVVEFGFIHPIKPESIELLNRISGPIGIALRSAYYRQNLQNLLEETQRQAEELQSQSEELRVNNEELEEQGRALRESQARLEQQQAEMEQTNAQLEEQTQLLEGQRDDLDRANTLAMQRAKELERASQYKSDFLANMSHELRTPLNSSLILAKLLGDNPAGNLTEEQVRFARTIQSSGNDLLALINDILDLSKIEAGHMEIQLQSVSLERLLKDLKQALGPLAEQKGLKLKTSIQPGCPVNIESDRQRIEQIMRNLISNAIKFTEKGSVEVSVSKTPEGRIALSVDDTGIGIAHEQQNAIFEAFRQADGTISRKYGGTGLGLSISRELARLLGGQISLKSEPGIGSSFIITLPLAYDANYVAPPPSASAPITSEAEAKKPDATITYRPSQMEDDRSQLTGSGRLILIIEDDESFARILHDLAHEMNFQCLIASTAEDALILARQYMPSAVVLDVGLPDNSGLSVLDRLKQDVRTRHIPVHVVSANDHEQTALSLGAMGYMFKPVKREELIESFKKLETSLVHRMRRVLVVEDDPVQQDSVRRLLASQDVETVGVGTAAECLEALKNSTFDCMVLDLSLPDASGYSLLETLSREDAYSFPPVIVYTGRDLSENEEQRLRRYSKSIIIKGAKSPERLLDEVTLFLHQVVADLPPEHQRMLEKAKNRDAILEGRRILIVEDDVRSVYAVTSILEPRGAILEIARNGREALKALQRSTTKADGKIDLVLMDVMMPEMDGLTATRHIRQNNDWRKLPIIMLTAKAMRDDQERCIEAGANDYMAKPIDVEKLLSLVRVWMPR